jgi:dihydroorotate dehydrogenase (fumarate)
VADLSTRYMGLELANPVIVGSSGLTDSVEGVRKCADAGAGAIVLKSIFEEQISGEVERIVHASGPSYWHSEGANYVRSYGRENAVEGYLDLIREAKTAVSIPVIASIHCVSAGVWTEFAQRVEQAGADGLELNIFVLPSDPMHDGRANEQVYIAAAAAVKSKTGIPVAFKVGPFFSGLANTARELSRRGVDALVLFNRFARFDFDIDEMKLKPAPFLSGPDEMLVPLRWISILSGQVDCDLAATTGVHDATGVVKQILAGAAAVQMCSALYQNGVDHIGTVVDGVGAWMDGRGYASIADFRGKMSQSESENPAAYERVQFMKATRGHG